MEARVPVTISLPFDACPPSVLEGGRGAVTARVGEKFFATSLLPDTAGCAVVPLWRGAQKKYSWALAYSLRIPDKPWVKGTVRVELDSTGAPIPGHEIDGIGDCMRHPEECAFGIDEAAARRIALRAGLKQGLGPWRAEFCWESRPKPRYVWDVANTLQSDGLGGESVRIDANSGKVLGIGPWLIETKPESGRARIDTIFD